MTVPNSLPLARELYIAQLAVQRAALATKRLLPDIAPSPKPSTIDPVSVATPTPLRRYLHPATWPLASKITNEPIPGHLLRRQSLAKHDKSPVTVADLAAQALLISALHAAFPSDLIIGEEDASALRNDPELASRVWELVCSTRLEDAESEALLARPGSLDDMLAVIDLGAGMVSDEMFASGEEGMKGRRFWCMDPIDGTSAYMQGGQYAISLALIQDGREVLGVLGCPNVKKEECAGEKGWRVEERNIDREGLGVMLSAVKGQGAVMRPIGKGVLEPAVRVDRGRGTKVDLREIHFVDSSNSPATLTEKVRELAEMTGATYPAGTELYASHMRYAAMVLGGREFVQLRWPKKPVATWSIWDHAGSQLIYTESGAGKVTDLAGNPIDFTAGKKLSKSWGLITADESIHGEIVKLVAEMMKKAGISQ
ncbi:hypothetical protein VTI74DRAFT_11647 [Chaetomium olivicolor]